MSSLRCRLAKVMTADLTSSGHAFDRPTDFDDHRALMSNQTPALTDEQRIEHYFELLEDCLDQCAEARGESLLIFLWAARRASEAIAYALAEGTNQAKVVRSQTFIHTTFLSELTKQGRVHQDIEPHLRTIWSTGSFGTHTQAPERAADAVTLTSCLAALLPVAEWFYEKSPLARPKTAKVVRALQDLKATRPRETARAREARELAAAVQRLTDAEVRLGVRVKELEAQLEQAHTQFYNVVSPPAAPPDARSRRPHIAVATLILGLGLGWGLRGGSPFASATPTEVVSAIATSAVTPSPPTTLLIQAAPTSAPPPPEAPETTPPPPTHRRCPSGMGRYAGEPVVFARGPRRQAWGKAGTPPAPSGPVAFCLDPAAVTTAAFGAFLKEQNRRPQPLHHAPRCNLGEKAGALPINCVTWAEATDYCASRAARLPSIGEWEFARRASQRVKLTPGTGEWAADAFPPAIFGFTAEGRPAGSHLFFDERYTRENLADAGPHEANLSWSRAEPSKANSDVSFRCASDPLP